jgi:hypothetical protein
MPKGKNRRPDSKDFADKRTLNPPTGRPKPPGTEEEQPAPREIGQYTARATPPQIKR